MFGNARVLPTFGQNLPALRVYLGGWKTKIRRIPVFCLLKNLPAAIFSRRDGDLDGAHVEGVRRLVLHDLLAKLP